MARRQVGPAGSLFLGLGGLLGFRRFARQLWELLALRGGIDSRDKDLEQSYFLSRGVEVDLAGFGPGEVDVVS